MKWSQEKNTSNDLQKTKGWATRNLRWSWVLRKCK